MSTGYLAKKQLDNIPTVQPNKYRALLRLCCPEWNAFIHKL